MNTQKLNLNLLQALDALLTEVNVTRAGEQLFISQSAMSNTLTQLRDVFEDELLVRGPNGMELTPKALELKPRLHDLIGEMRELLSNQSRFVPATSNRVFKIGMSDVAEFMLLPILNDMFRRQAPYIQLYVQHVNHITSYEEFVQSGIEIATGCFAEESPHLCMEPNLGFKGSVIADINHPYMQEKITLSKYLKARHIRLKYQALQTQTNIDETLARLGKKRNIVVTVPHIVPMFFMLQNTDLIASIASVLGSKQAKNLGLAVQPLPFSVPWKSTYTVWPRAQSKEPGLLWLRERFHEAAQIAVGQCDRLKVFDS